MFCFPMAIALQQVVLATEIAGRNLLAAKSLDALQRSNSNTATPSASPIATTSSSASSLGVENNTFRGKRYGRCGEARCACVGYLAPPADRGAACDACAHAPLAHAEL